MLNGMMIPIWTYWEGPIPPLIKLCLKSLKRWAPAFHPLGPEDLEAMGGREVMRFTEGLPIPQRTDLIRLFLIRRYGGVWIDADSIATGSLEWLGHQAAESDLIGVGRNTRGILATPWGARAGSPLVSILYDRCKGLLEKMKTGEHVPYGQTSVGILSEVYRANKKRPGVRRLQHWQWSRVPWSRAREVFLRSGPPRLHRHCPFWSHNAKLYHLTNVVSKPLARRSLGALLRGPTFLTFLIQKALGLPPAIPLPAWEILRRVPIHLETRGAEVGVYRGANAYHLLQQRPNLRLLLVDPWGPGPDPGYQGTGDYQAFFTPAQWEDTYHVARRAVGFAGPRAEICRLGSWEAAGNVPDGTLGFVYLDANHSLAAVLGDLGAWFPKVKPGGWIGGHDYDHWLEPFGLYGVHRAVDTFAKDRGLTVERGHGWTWFIRIPGG